MPNNVLGSCPPPNPMGENLDCPPKNNDHQNIDFTDLLQCLQTFQR